MGIRLQATEEWHTQIYALAQKNVGEHIYLPPADAWVYPELYPVELGKASITPMSGAAT